MNIEKTITALNKKGYQVHYFNSGEEAVQYLENSIENKTIGFGGSKTLTDLNLQARLSKKNTVWNPDFPENGEDFMTVAHRAIASDCYFLSANGLSEDGIIVNMDETGNRLAGSVF